MATLLECRHISKSFSNPSGEGERIVLGDISFNIEKGSTTAVTGPSGSGKSTLLNIIGGLDKPSSGEVIFGGNDIALLTDRELARLRSRDIGFIFQLHHLLPQCTVLENILIPILPLGLNPSETEEVRGRALVLLERIGLDKHGDHFPAQLSGGEMGRVAVIRALINRPSLILADEPTGSLDRESAEGMGELLVELNREQETTLILVTHSEELAGRMEYRYGLKNGDLEMK
jgi:lipoprotein-releasing system ATP-binding protein